MTLLAQLTKTTTLRAAWKVLHKNPRSSGIDEVTIDEYRDNLENELRDLSEALVIGKYQPSKLKGHPLEKGKNTARISDKKSYRILKIPTVRDRIVQKAIEGLIGDHLNKMYDIAKNGVSFAYMDGGSVEKAAQQIRKYNQEGYSWVYKADIVGFFDNINKDKMLDMIRAALPDDSLIPLIDTFLRLDIANARELKERTKEEYKFNPMLGVAQGSALSPVYANVFLSSLDQLAIKNKYNMVRYADDLVVLTKTKEEAIEAHKVIENHLKELELEVHPLLIKGDLPIIGHEKHSTVNTYNGLLFLGLMFKGSKIYPSGESYESAIWTVRRAANNNKLPFIKKLTSIEARVQGWCSAYAFTDFREEPTKRIDKLLEDVMMKVLRQSDLKPIHNKTAMQALEMQGYKKRLNSIKDKRAKKEIKAKK